MPWYAYLHVLLQDWYRRFGLAIFLSLAAAPTWADDLKGIAERWTSNLKGLGPLLVLLFAIIGLICIGTGLHKFTQARRGQNQVVEALTYTIVGSLLLSIPAFSGLLSGTSFGNNAASSGLDALGVQ